MRLLGAAAMAALAVVPVLGAAEVKPVNPHASPEARALLEFLYSISGKYTLSGQHNYPNTIARWTDRAYDLTAKYPAVFGQDFGFQGEDDKDSTLARPALIEEAKRQYRNGAIVTMTWHAVRPTEDEPVTFRDSVQGHLTDFEWSELLTPGTRLYNRWCAQVDVVAGYLRQLRDARVPVLWRPYHEMNGGWFWWGGRKGKEGSSALYRQLFERFVNVHHLDNLVWVWNANAPGAGGSGPGPYTDFFPGAEYADVLSVDVYGPFAQSHYDGLLALAGAKPVALGEVGFVPSPATLKEQPRWTWFMTWSEFVEEANPLEAVQATYEAPMTLNRGDARLKEAMAAIRKVSAEAAPAPVTPEASVEASALLARLAKAGQGGILSGQENEPKTVAGASDRVFEIAAKHPAIYGQELGIAKEAGIEPGAARQAIIDEAKRQHKNGSAILLSWRAAPPTGGEPAAEAAVRARLTDFEWNELLTPGTRLHERWCEQVDAIAASLKELQKAGVPVLWRPYPQSNGAQAWWAGRKGIRGSAALYLQLFDRLARHHKLRNLVWVWSAAAPRFGPDSPGQLSDYFPGLLYVDAIALGLDDMRSAFRRDVELAVFGAGKAIGLELAGRVPAPASFEQPSRWAWFTLPPAQPDADALRALYGHPRVMAR